MLENHELQASSTNNRRASRLVAADALRGLIIAHKHPPGAYWGGGFPVYYDALTFITRLVTHLAPSGFFLLMGVGMVLFSDSRRRRGWSEWAIIKHFLARGVVLIALQLMLVNRAWELHPIGWGLEIYIGVLVALGGSMILATFGRTPLFFYITHLFLYLGLGLLVAPSGTSIPVMYPFWLLGLLILYPLCLWYARFKERQPAGSVLQFL